MDALRCLRGGAFDVKQMRQPHLLVKFLVIAGSTRRFQPRAKVWARRRGRENLDLHALGPKAQLPPLPDVEFMVFSRRHDGTAEIAGIIEEIARAARGF
jgi:hypothetical protein